MEYGLISLLLIIIITIGIKYYKVKKSISSMIKTIDDILNGGDKLFIFSEGKILTGNLAFKINDLISAYFTQKENFENERKTKKELLSNLSHDARTPLVSVIGYLEAVTQKRIPKEKETDYINTALEKSLSLKECINQLFEFVQLDADEISVNIEKIDVSEALRQIVIDFIPYMEKEKIYFDSGIPDDELYIMADGNAVKRIFQNLIRNMIIYGKSGNYLGIFVSLREGDVYVDVKDKGDGIDKEHLPFVFERLYKADFSRNNGGGLGLAIAKELTEKMNGRIMVLNSIPGDTVFRVIFPLIK